jgi:hypothetical protein
MMGKDIMEVILCYMDFFSYTENEKLNLFQALELKNSETTWEKANKNQVVNYANKNMKVLTIHYLNGEFHRSNDLPAVENSDGSLKEWWYCGVPHRLNGPAVIRPGPLPERLKFPTFYYDITSVGDVKWEMWWVDGKLHRTDGPAIIATKNDEMVREFWYKNGKRHRLDGPAIDSSDEYKEWWLNGKKHRLDGPAIVRSNGDKEWWVNGKRHRLDGPAIIQNNMHKEEWYKNGKLHRTDGPAVKLKNRHSEHEKWYKNGKLHRTDGPAVIQKSCGFDDSVTITESWWLNGEKFCSCRPQETFWVTESGDDQVKWYIDPLLDHEIEFCHIKIL